MTRREWVELGCVLCGQLIQWEGDETGGVGRGGTAQCAANGNGAHIKPESPAAERAKEIHAAWLRSPFDAPVR